MGIRRLRKIAQTICEGLGFSKHAELSILLTGDGPIHVLNRQWRGKDKATDVLSFPQMGREDLSAAGDAPVLGDVVISLDTAARQAEVAGMTLEQEVTRLLIHGVLHLVGHDHVHGGRQAAKMRREEERLWALVWERLEVRPPG